MNTTTAVLSGFIGALLIMLAVDSAWRVVRRLRFGPHMPTCDEAGHDPACPDYAPTSGAA